MKIGFLSLSSLYIMHLFGAAHSGSEQAQESKIRDALCAKIHLGSRVLTGHTEQVNTVAVSRDGQLIASGSWDNTVRVWNMRTGNCVHVLKGHTSGITAVVFHPNNNMLASGSWDDTVRIWDLHTGTCERTIKADGCGVLSLAYTSEGRELAAGSENGYVSIWNAFSGACMRHFKCHKGGVNSLVFKRNSLKFVSGSRSHLRDDGKVSVYDANAEKQEQIFEHYSNWLGAAALGRDDRTLAYPSGNVIRICSMQNSTLKKVLTGHTDWVSSITYNIQKNLLASAAFDHTVRLWDTKSGACTAVLEGHTGWISSVAFSPFGKTVVTGSRDKTVRIWFDPSSDIRSIVDPEEIQLLSVAAHDWQNNIPHHIEINNPPFKRLIERFPYLNDPRLFDVHVSQENESMSQEGPFDSSFSSSSEDDADVEDISGEIILPARMRSA